MTNLVTNVVCTVIINLITNGPTVTTDEVRQPYSDRWYYGNLADGSIIKPAETKREVTEVIERRIVKFLYCDEEREIVSERPVSYLERVWKRRDVWDEQPPITNKPNLTWAYTNMIINPWSTQGIIYLNNSASSNISGKISVGG